MDKNVMNILKATGVDFKAVEFQMEEGAMFVPHNDALLARIKNKDTGYHYDTHYGNAVNMLDAAISVIRYQSTSANELERNIKPLMDQFITDSIACGLCTQDELEFETSLKVSAFMDTLDESDPRFSWTARHIIKVYGESLSNNQREIDLIVNELKARLAKTSKYRNYMLDNDTERQIVDKARKEGCFKSGKEEDKEKDKERENLLSHLYAMKEVITNKFMMLANSRSVGKSMYGRSILFAGLYLSILNAEGTRRENKRKEDGQEYRDWMIKAEERYPSQPELDAYLANIPFEVRRIGSLFSLFPYGIMELLYMNKVGIFKEHAPAPVNIAVMFSYPNGEPTQEVKASLVDAFLGRELEFMDGTIVGTSLSVTPGDKYRTSDSQKTLTVANVADVKQRQGAIRAQEVMNLVFKQNVWRDGHFVGKVAYVTAYKQGIKLWIQDYRVAK